MKTASTCIQCSALNDHNNGSHWKCLLCIHLRWTNEIGRTKANEKSISATIEKSNESIEQISQTNVSKDTKELKTSLFVLSCDNQKNDEFVCICIVVPWHRRLELNFQYNCYHRWICYSIEHCTFVNCSLRLACVCLWMSLFEIKKRYLIYVTSIFDSFWQKSVQVLLYIYFVVCLNIYSIFGALPIIDCVVCHEMKCIRACSIFQWFAGRCI